MHPIVTLELTEQRHADLLRAAEQHRLARAFGTKRRSTFSSTVRAVMAGLRSTIAPSQSPAQACCA